MAMEILQVNPSNPEQVREFLKVNLSKCIDSLTRGQAIVYPTETLYGLGVDIKNPKAIEKLFELKGRPGNLPIAIAVTDLDQVEAFAVVSPLADKIIKNCIPKPITILLKAKKTINPRLTGGSELIGIRFPSHPVTEGIIKTFGPITATSANYHGGPEPVEISGALAQFDQKVEIFIDSGPCIMKKPSTVIDTTGDTIKIIRHGACSGFELDECLRGK
jgi:L-threonylcarbamoyladenylate synthase